MPRNEIPRFTVVRDTREQRGWEFPTKGRCLGTVVETMKEGDYTLQGTSPAKKAGYDASILSGATPNRDIGAHQAASGGLGGANKRAGKQ